jgi:O-antigen/teichoic acid export membrane protein
MGQTVAKNTFWLTVSNFGGRLIKAVVIIYAARVLGTAGYGLFSYAVTLAGFLSLFMDPGINSVLLRESAKSPNDRGLFLSTTFVIKIVLLVFGVCLIIFVGPFFSTLPGAAALLPIAAFILMFDTLREFFMSFVRAIEKMQWEAGVFIFTNVAIVGFGFIALILHPTPKALGWGYALGTTLGGIAAILVLKDYWKDLFSRFSAKLIKPIFQSAWPFAIVGALGLLLTNTDILIISWMRDASDVGIYSAGIRIVQVLYLIPGVLQISTLPLFSRLANHDNKKFRATFERIMSILFVASIPIAIGGVVVGTQILSFIFGSAFAPGGTAFKLLMVTMIVDFPGSIIAAAIFTYGHQKSLIITSAIGGISNVVLDLLLIPRFGMTGSAIATLIAQTLSNGYLWYMMKRINYFEVLPRLKKVCLASIIMGFATMGLMLLHVEVFLNITLCVVFYFALLKVLREPLLDELFAIIPGGRRFIGEVL